MSWKGATAWKKAKRLPIIADNIIEGFVKSYDRFKMYWINRAGHMVRTYETLSLLFFSFSFSHSFCIYCNVAERAIYRFNSLRRKSYRFVKERKKEKITRFRYFRCYKTHSRKQAKRILSLYNGIFLRTSRHARLYEIT